MVPGCRAATGSKTVHLVLELNPRLARWSKWRRTRSAVAAGR
jgi:hypothetical protein